MSVSASWHANLPVFQQFHRLINSYIILTDTCLSRMRQHDISSSKPNSS